MLLGLIWASGNVNVLEYQQQEKPVDTLKKDSIDPVCGMKVKAGSTRTSTFEKVVYGFCAESCKKKFEMEPTKYLKKKRD